MPTGGDDYADALARSFAMAKGRRARRRRGWSASAWSRTARTTLRTGAASQTATEPEPPSDGTDEAHDLTLSEFLEGLPGQRRVDHVEPEDFPDY
jgi:hypothetical protein